MGAELTFLRAAGTVTGSRSPLRVDKWHTPIVNGLVQGRKKIHRQNRACLSFDPGLLGNVVVPHAYVDHEVR